MNFHSFTLHLAVAGFRSSSVRFVAAMSILCACSGSNQTTASHNTDLASSGLDGAVVDGAASAASASLEYVNVAETVLVADTSDYMPLQVDPNLVDGRGIAIDSTGLLWVADDGSGLVTAYQATGGLEQTIGIPGPGDAGPGQGSPTGVVCNSGTAFLGDTLIVATEDGIVVGWQSGAPAAVLRLDNSESGVYKGLTACNLGGVPTLCAANFAQGTVDVIDSSYALQATTAFVDPTVPAGYAPYNVAALGGMIYVAYAVQDTDMLNAVPGAGSGAISVFNATGTFVRRLVTGAPLNAPYGLALAPPSFGPFASALLVGNTGDGTIYAFDPTTGVELGALQIATGVPLAIDGLKGFAFGLGATGESTSELFFASGPYDANDGLLGRLDLATSATLVDP